jgi:hypothetical protein
MIPARLWWRPHALSNLNDLPAVLRKLAPERCNGLPIGQLLLLLAHV